MRFIWKQTHNSILVSNLFSAIFLVLFEPPRDKTNKMACAPSEDSNQPGHPPSLIRVFAALGPELSSCGQRRLWSDWADAHADLSLCWAQMPLCWFCHDAAHFMVNVFFCPMFYTFVFFSQLYNFSSYMKHMLLDLFNRLFLYGKSEKGGCNKFLKCLKYMNCFKKAWNKSRHFFNIVCEL